MARFCPYCGKQINQRAKFCPLCGKSIPARERTGPLVIEETGARTAARPVEIPVSRPRVDRSARVEERPRATRASNGSSATTRFAATTQVVIGESEQAGFGLRYGAWMFDFLLTMMAMMGFTFALTAVSRRSVVGSNSDLVLVLLLTLVLFLLNFIVLAGRIGQTVG
ncbi:MAG TPA: zinc ribbon domain-containing protein, partial [Blastocatellia bacterium]